MKSIFAMIVTAVALSACNHEVIRPNFNESAPTAVKGESVDLSIDWIKNKAGSVDFLVWLNNRTQQPIYATADSYKLNYMGTDFIPLPNQGLIQVPAGEKLKVLLVFKMPVNKARTGKILLKISPIYQGVIGGDKKVKLSDMHVETTLVGKAN